MNLCKRLVGIGAVLLLLGGACSVYNESCPVTNPKQWGTVKVDLDVRQCFVRRNEAPIGDFFADALIAYDYGLKDGVGNPLPIDLALFNSGAIREEVKCGQGLSNKRQHIPKGPITDQDVYQVMPFYEDSVVVATVTGAQLRQILEHSVNALSETTSGTESEAGSFLQISSRFGPLGVPQIRVEVDCSLQAEILNADGMTIKTAGQRIKSIKIDDVLLSDTAEKNIATLNYLVEKDPDTGKPNDGFVTFQDELKKPPVINTNFPVIDVVHQWIERYSATRLEDNYPRDEDRLVMTNCSTDCAE